MAGSDRWPGLRTVYALGPLISPRLPPVPGDRGPRFSAERGFFRDLLTGERTPLLSAEEGAEIRGIPSCRFGSTM